MAQDPGVVVAVLVAVEVAVAVVDLSVVVVSLFFDFVLARTGVELGLVKG